MKVNIVEWHGVSTWHWKLTSDNTDGGYVDELCGICRVAFDGTCPNCTYPGYDCPLILGAGCTHNFHLHCILKWLEQDTSKGLCPMCRQIFTYKQPEFSLNSTDLSNLQTIIEGHKIMRERMSNANDQDFEAFGDEADLQLTE